MEKLSPSNPNNTAVPATGHPQCFPTDTATGTVKSRYSLRSSDSSHSHPKVVPKRYVAKSSVKFPCARKSVQPQKYRKSTRKLKNKPGRRDGGKDL